MIIKKNLFQFSNFSVLNNHNLWDGSGGLCSGCRSRSTLTSILEPQETVSQALTLLGVARFIAWRLKRPFLGECRRSSRHFWSRQACLGYSPTPRPTQKTLRHSRPFGGMCGKHRLPPSRRTWQFSDGHFYLLYEYFYFVYMFYSSIHLFHLFSLPPCFLFCI